MGDDSHASGTPDATGGMPDDGRGLTPAWIREALRNALECEAEGAWVERRLAAGMLDESLREHVRAAALAALDDAVLDEVLPDALAIEAASADTEVVGATTRAGAVAAWDDRSRPVPVLTFPNRVARKEPLRARRLEAPLILRPFAAAALLLVALGAGLLLFGGDEEAEAGLQLRALSRRHVDSIVGMSQVEPGYFATMGRLFAPREDEQLSFGLAHDGLVVVRAGDAVRVTRPGTRPAAGRLAGMDAVLRLEAGEARLAAGDAPLPLEVDGAGLLVLEEGAAHVALHAESANGAPAVALAERSVARFYRAQGTSVALAGPTRVLLTADGIQSFGAPARSLFHELAFFGGALPRPTPVRTVSARLFEVRSGRAQRGRQDVRVLASDPGTDAQVTLAWRPPPVLADARSLRVALRAPTGTTVTLAQGAGGGPRAAVERAGSSSEPGVAAVELTLGEDWYERLPDGRLELTLRVPASANSATTRPGEDTGTRRRRRKPAVAWFDGISLVLGPGEDGLPKRARAASSQKAKSVPSRPDRR